MRLALLRRMVALQKVETKLNFIPADKMKKFKRNINLFKNIIFIILLISGAVVYAQPLKVLYFEGSVRYVKTHEKIKLECGQTILDNCTILIGNYSQLIYHNSKKFAVIKTKGQYTYSQLIKILDSDNGLILSNFASYVFNELAAKKKELSFKNQLGVIRSLQPSLILNDEIQSTHLSDSLLVGFVRFINGNKTKLYTSGVIVPIRAITSNAENSSYEELPITDFIDHNGRITFDTTQKIIFRISNVSKQQVYFSWLDIQPDNVINIIYLNGSETREMNQLEAGEIWESQIFRINLPAGIEVWKLIVTSEPLDLLTFFKACERTRQENSINKTVESNYLEMMRQKSETNYATDLSLYSISFDIK
jgi:hypothetical protein